MCGNALWCWRITSFRFTKVGHFRHNWSLTPQVGHKIFFMDHQTQSLDFCGWKFSFDVNTGFSLHYNHCLFVFCCDVTPTFHHAMLRNGRLLFVVRRLLQTVQRCVLFSRVNSGEPQIPSLHIFPHLLKMSVINWPWYIKFIRVCYKCLLLGHRSDQVSFKTPYSVGHLSGEACWICRNRNL